MTTARHTSSRQARSAEGFSLIEMLIALYLLAVGLMLGLALFPAAMRENQNSSNYIIGTLICQNAVSMAKMRLAEEFPLQGIDDAGDLDSVDDPNVLRDCSDEYFGPNDLLYPAGETPKNPADPADPNETRVLGFKMLARKIKADQNDREYSLFFLAYRKLEPNYTIEISPKFGGFFYQNPDGVYERDKLNLDRFASLGDPSAGGTDDFRVGAPVFSDANGSWATIVRIEDDENGDTIATLSNELIPLNQGDEGLMLHTIFEYDNDNIIQSRSSIMSVTQTRITLKPQP